MISVTSGTSREAVSWPGSIGDSGVMARTMRPEEREAKREGEAEEMSLLLEEVQVHSQPLDDFGPSVPLSTAGQEEEMKERELLIQT